MESEDTKLPCVDKMAFDTKKEAEGSAVAVSWQHGTKLKPYKCQHCNLWHLASTYEDF